MSNLKYLDHVAPGFFEEKSADREDPVGRGQLLYTECLRQLGVATADPASLSQDDYDSMMGDAIEAKWAERGLVNIVLAAAERAHADYLVTWDVQLLGSPTVRTASPPQMTALLKR